MRKACVDHCLTLLVIPQRCFLVVTNERKTKEVTENELSVRSVYYLTDHMHLRKEVASVQIRV